MRFSSLLGTVSLAGAAAHCLSLGGRSRRHTIRNSITSQSSPEFHSRDAFQDLVTWDEHSLLVKGERIMLFSGEVHPFRLPVPSLWGDVLDKIKALGFNCASFYVDWALLEGKPGEFTAEGVFDWGEFFRLAKEKGIWLIARPGPYVNAEVSGGGFPGWLQRTEAVLRTSQHGYLEATDNYVARIGAMIADAQITNGGPVILYQPENEYSGAIGIDPFPQPEYMAYVEQQARDAGIVVPFINNDAWTGGHNAPGTGLGEVDIYGHDGYPLGFDCANPTAWPAGYLPTNWRSEHLRISPSTPYTIPEFQGGSFDPYGGLGFGRCSELLNHEFERVFYKNLYAAGVTIFNIYMTFGGTNWGNLGHAGGYSSYDYGAAIQEDGRTITREKYAELKLQAQFMLVTPDYVTAVPAESATTRVYSPSDDISITPIIAETPGHGSFFVARHVDYASLASTSYTLTLPSSTFRAGNVTIPQLGGSLTLNGRDSKVHLADYKVGEHRLLYSTAEVFTWKAFEDKTVLVLYGGDGELHEVAFGTGFSAPEVLEPFRGVGGGHVKTKTLNGTTILQFTASATRKVVRMGHGLDVYLLDRNTAYNYWVPILPTEEHGYFGSNFNPAALIVAGGYLVRSAAVDGSTLSLRADFNSSCSLEIMGVPRGVDSLRINDKRFRVNTNNMGNWVAEYAYGRSSRRATAPDLDTLDWKAVDSLPEIGVGYDDGEWPAADHEWTSNTIAPLQTQTSLYGSDYGFNAGVLVFRGHFTASGEEGEVYLSTQGGSAYGCTAWLTPEAQGGEAEWVGSWTGVDALGQQNSTFPLPSPLEEGARYVLTVLVDNTGLDGNWVVGLDLMKAPRGILDYSIRRPLSSAGANSTAGETRVDGWKLTGNLGGEDYLDKSRGPLNEGGLWFERHGLHLPGAPARAGFERARKGPTGGTHEKPGVRYYTATLELDVEEGWDVPFAFVFDNSTETGAYRAFVYVNGWQFGRYVSNVGPQTRFPVPEGILNHQGENTLGLAVWALEPGAAITGFELEAGVPVWSGRDEVVLVEGAQWEERQGVY
ncbi:hypothetical protein MKZ38_009214 [Zalerion maritima]|uniref:Beta-galactosidase n=1 Tax=Zalerion maritima TaxID=339359 RepID=A0AAD5WN78_9PEZI|nr:hypothetical protein MKZ38_009214 [Zalerion maritima]